MSARHPGAPAPRLSLVVIAYEMGRELPRTLLSLAPPYQRDCSRGDYEVIVVDNGSRRPVTAQSMAPLDLDLAITGMPAPTPSPVPALNHGLHLARGDLIGVWIDGARLASPGLLRAAMAAAGLHPRPVVVTANYHLGPARQPLSCQEGYDQQAEDRLLNAIGWPTDGYRLYDIAVPADREGERGAMRESNAIFMPRALWAELGGYDPRFTSAGGGACNPDLLVRACALPGTQLIRILGEATFHQYHGGATSGDPQGLEMVMKRYAREYYQIRNQPLRRIRDPGWLVDGFGRRIEPSAPPLEMDQPR